MNAHAVQFPRRRLRRAETLGCAVMISSWCLLRLGYLTAAWAALSASAGVALPLSAFWTAVQSCSEIFGYFVPRLSPVRALATFTASTQGLRVESAAS